jgi:hypothetical protein
MRRRSATANTDLQQRTDRLPRAIEPPDDLWPRIEAALDRLPVDSLAVKLEREIEPPVDLWPRIEAELDPARGRRQLAAAALAFVGLAGVIALGIARIERAERPAPVVSIEPSSIGPTDGVAWWLRESEPIPDDVAQVLLQNLELVRGERRDIELALAQSPNNERLRDLWTVAYTAELTLEDHASRVVHDFERGYGI